MAVLRIDVRLGPECSRKATESAFKVDLGSSGVMGWSYTDCYEPKAVIYVSTASCLTIKVQYV